MNNGFKDRLLVELKAEVAERAARRRSPAPRWMPSRRLLAGAGVVGVAAATALVVPLVTGQEPPAYALTEGADGSINLKIHELRDADQVEKDLAGYGITADVTYLPLGKRCGNGRAKRLPGDDVEFTKEQIGSKDPVVQQQVRDLLDSTPSAKAIRPRDGITIYPQYIKPGQRVLIEAAENPGEVSVANPGVVWSFSGHLVEGPIAPCEVVDDPSAFEVGDATPPPGS
ncbi:hypothetical protein DP939_21855 [Spongiactinospora rosea]|uniref:Uncharacterized protein n=1 Tax=Spongiactinospora rosea TaxID=2248750 RepID=A0A366LWS6_9ACTN|nr:hypothetical protein [Spongiactinospora rosea]RBQ18020.1 hypothetical protein DP939_21855 [Spongiactinospora rosea]